MPTKDYVKRPRAKTKQTQSKAKNKRHKKTTKNSMVLPLPWFRILLSFAIIALFVYGLYFLQSMDRDDSADVVETDSTVIDETSEAVQEGTKDTSSELAELPPLPVLGEEEWQYIDALPEYSVEVDATAPIELDKEYIMQCGAFRTSERANELKAKLAFQGKESRIVQSSGGRWHRVVLGPYQQKRQAEKDRSHLRGAGIRGCKIW